MSATRPGVHPEGPRPCRPVRKVTGGFHAGESAPRYPCRLDRPDAEVAAPDAPGALDTTGAIWRLDRAIACR